GAPGNSHCDLDNLVDNAAAQKQYLERITSRGLEISALSCHGNPLHPNKVSANADDESFRKTVRLASQLGVQNVITFSGCPGDHENAKYPNWVTCPWPTDFADVLKWQWDEVATPYWSEVGKYAADNNVRVAIELHPGFLGYHTESFWKLREIGGEAIGVNFDPSHLFWQGMDPLVCVRELKDAIFHVHMKDTWLDQPNIRRNGVLDTKQYTDEVNRSWIFRTVGYGHGPEFWRSLVSELRLAGYDGALSIEHEDSLMSINEGFTKAVEFLKSTVIRETPDEAWWG
ncbi:MAG: sugar phosphate isomerase/epimerase, partial [Chloroflexia bacterium]|nr:sugar phosphate isomerase/epimerase [Chloroflexia bacterium]